MYALFGPSRTTNLASKLMTLKMSRDHELEADACGIYLMSRAGFQPEGLSQFHKRLGGSNGELFSTHPSGEHRVKAIQEEIAKKKIIVTDNQDVEKARRVFRAMKRKDSMKDNVVKETQSEEKFQNKAF